MHATFSLCGMIEENYDPPGHDCGGEALSDASRGEHGHHPVITQPMRRSALTAKTCLVFINLLTGPSTRSCGTPCPPSPPSFLTCPTDVQGSLQLTHQS